MTLLELSALYDESATRIRVRMAQLRADAKEQTDPAAAQALRQRIAELTPLLREMRSRQLPFRDILCLIPLSASIF